MALARATSVNLSRKDAVSRATRVEPSRKPNLLRLVRTARRSLDWLADDVPEGIP
jgi:hypothetical protein